LAGIETVSHASGDVFKLHQQLRRCQPRDITLSSETRQGLLKAWHQHWPFSELKLLGYSLVEPDVGDVFTAYSQEYMEHRGQVSAAEAK